MRHLPILLIILMLVCTYGCGGKQTNIPVRGENNDNVSLLSDSFIHYENDYFYFDYPSNMEIVEEDNTISDSLPSYKDGLSVTLYCHYLPIQLHFVKSAMFDVFDSPEGWRDLSLQLKEHADSTYIGCYDTQDSIDFKGNKAATFTFVLKDYGDTLVQHQFVVLRENKDLFYLNYTASKDMFNLLYEIADTVFKSFDFK